MHDEAHVALVDAHAEGHCGGDHLDVVAGESVLHALAFLRRQAGVVGRGRHAGGGELAGDLLRALAAEAVDDAGLARTPVEERLELVQRLALVDHGVADVGAVEAGDVDRRVRQPEAPPHVVAGLGIGGGRARDEGHAGEQRAQAAELYVLRAEVVTPLRDAVCLVDGEQGDAGGGGARGPGPRGIADRRKLLQAAEEGLGHQRLGGDVQELELPCVQGAQHAPGLVALERRVVGGGADAGRPQRVDLVLHQGDERRDHDARAGPEHRRQLVAERLASAGGHEHEGVAAGHEVRDDLLLVGAERVEAEDVAQQRARRGWSGWAVRCGGGGHGPSLARLTDGRWRREVERTARAPGGEAGGRRRRRRPPARVTSARDHPEACHVQDTAVEAGTDARGPFDGQRRTRDAE